MPKSKSKASTATEYPKAKKKRASTKPAASSTNGAQADISFEKDLWGAAVHLRGNIAPADYKHYVLPLLFLRYLSLKYERRYEQLEALLHDDSSNYFTDDPAMAQDILNDPLEYKSAGIFIMPEAARWEYVVKHAQDDDIKLRWATGLTESVPIR